MTEKIIPPNDMITKHLMLRGPVLLSAPLLEVSTNTSVLINLQM